MLRNGRILMGVVSIILGTIACGTIPGNILVSNQPESTAVGAAETPIPALPTVTLIPEATSASDPFTLSMLQNTQYHSPDWGDYQLVDGVFYRPPAAPGESAQIYSTQLDERFVSGDLNADGLEDAVVFLRTQNGGTGHFVELAAMLNQDGNPNDISTVSLGDRVIVESVQITNGVIILGMRVQGPNDGMCCPSQLETWQFQLQNGQLIKLP